MHNVALKSSIYLLVVVSAFVWFILASLNGLDLSKAKDFFSLAAMVVSLDLIFVAIFTKWGWKLSFFHGWLVLFPNISGTWIGNIYSEWTNLSTGEKPDIIPVMLTIKQSFFHVSCVMTTGEMNSHSYSEGFEIDSDQQVKLLTHILANHGLPFPIGVLLMMEQSYFKLLKAQIENLVGDIGLKD